MLHSNTDAGAFKLQPAPRPKKRPQNPPVVQPRSIPRNSYTFQPPSKASASSSDTDASSLRSCFEDDDPSLTPKASLFNVPLQSPKPGVAKHEPRSRSSTISISSATTTRSVSRLLAAMSFPSSTRCSARSPEQTLTVVLTNKSPTPSSPLFPRRSLMRSVSSTCINASPTSPSGLLRKRMGWRGALSAQHQQETSILMSPASPLTPRRAEALHTPTQASIASVLNPTHLAPYSTEQAEEQIEPLSATLKALGAKRRTENFPTASIPVQSPIDEAAQVEVFETLQRLKSPPYAELELDSSRESFQLLTAQRKIFHLPTWVRFEANHHARTQVAEKNRAAAAGFSSLAEAMPKTSHLGDVAPDSPNGELFAGFDLNPTSAVKEEEVVKVVRRPTMATLRNTDRVPSGKVMGALRSALPPFREKYRIKGSPKKPPTPPANDKDRRDGWGGILTRSSWFPGHAKGPLVSPLSPVKRTGLKTFLLQPHKGDDEWEDISPNPASSSTPAQGETSFLELNDAPRFFNRPGATSCRRWFRSSPSPCPSKKVGEEMELNTWHTRPLSPTSTGNNETIASKLITNGTRSIENRPVHKERTISLRIRVAMFTITAVLIAAIVINIVILSHTPSGPKGEGKLGPMANLGLGYIPTTTTAGAEGTRESSIAKAAQLSQP